MLLLLLVDNAAEKVQTEKRGGQEWLKMDRVQPCAIFVTQFLRGNKNARKQLCGHLEANYLRRMGET